MPGYSPFGNKKSWDPFGATRGRGDKGGSGGGAPAGNTGGSGRDPQGRTSFQALVQDQLGGTTGHATLGQRFGDVTQPGGPAAAAAIAEAARIRDATEQTGKEQAEFATGEFEQSNAPTITDTDIERQYGQAAEKAGLDAQALMGRLREHLGAAGVRGGVAADMGARIEMERLGQLSGARRDLKIFKAQADAQDRISRYQRAMGLAQARSQFLEPSPFLADTLGSASDRSVTLEGIKQQAQAAKDAADAAKPGPLDIITGLAGLAIPLL